MEDGSETCPECGNPGVPVVFSSLERTTQFVADNPVLAMPTLVDRGPVEASGPVEGGTWVIDQIPGYEILSEVGEGGMGVIYAARQVSLNRVVALKMIHQRLEIDERELQRFRVEAEAVARLDHPNVVRIHDFGEYIGRPYFSMELIAGGSLAGPLSRGPLPIRASARLAEILALAIHHAHGRGIIHRDLKPANVLLAPKNLDPAEDGEVEEPKLCTVHPAEIEDYEPKIADFGLAKCIDDDPKLTRSQAVMGTPLYMAPEQALGSREIGPAVDVYSLGAILYECLTGGPPFRGATREQTLVQLLNDEPIRPMLHRPEIPADLEYICLKCLEKDPLQRYASAQDLAEDLRCFLAGEHLVNRPQDEWGRQERWAQRAGYEILELDGCNVLGMVYKALQTRLNRPVLFKTLSALARSDPGRMQRFRHEAEVMASIHHPNIVQIYDFGEVQSQPYLALEYVDGGTLADRYQELPQPPRQAAQLVRTLARAIHAAHERGVIHTDLRPFHIVFTGNGVPKITGFGLAWLLDKEQDNPGPRSWRTLSNYIAPEQARETSDPLSPATDVHALGALFYELLTGQPPFLAETVQKTLENIQSLEPVPPSELNPAVPGILDTICLRCLRKEPGERFASAEELAEEIRRYLVDDQPQTDEFEMIPGYELLEEVGRGGTGVVYKARQLSLDRLVALKIFREESSHVLTANKAVARLTHPNLVPVFDCGERDGLLYVVEELVRGQTLDQVISGTPWDIDETIDLVITLAETIHLVHPHGIIHRNLKPGVIHLVPTMNRPIISDTLVGCVPRIGSFDLAYLKGSEVDLSEANGRLIGTPKYMSPEQANGQTELLGPTTDVYGLGCILYEMLTAQPAFTHDSVIVLLNLVRTRPPIPPRFYRKEIPRELEAICLKCLEKDPNGRFSTGAALADTLRDLQSRSDG